MSVSVKKEDIGIKLAKELESIEDERIDYRTRIEAKNIMIEDLRDAVYYLAEKVAGHKVSAVIVFRQKGDGFDTNEVAYPLVDNIPPIHHIEMKVDF